MANANDVFNKVGDGLANASRWLMSWFPGGSDGGTYTTIEEERDSGTNTYAPPDSVAGALQVITGRPPTAWANNDFMALALVFIGGLLFINIIFRR